MRNRLPRRQELFIFLAMSVACTVIVQITGKYDVGLALMAAPVFLVAALMGLRRHGALEAGGDSPAANPADAPSAANDAAA